MSDDAGLIRQACASGCKSQGDHVTDCTDDGCRGCLPRGAEHGNLCQRCWTALTRDIATAPSLVYWLREQIEPGAPSQDGKTTGSRVPPAPLSADAVAAADDLHAQLASWVLLILEEHPDHLAGPTWEGSMVRPASKRVIKPTHDELGYPVHLGYHPPTWQSAVVYEPARVVGIRPAEDDKATGRIARWLLTRLADGWTDRQDWTPLMVTEITNVTATLLARWPQEARARYITDLPCPECDRVSLVYYPVTYQMGETIIQCEHHDCGARIPEDRWEWHAIVHADGHPKPEREKGRSIGSGHEGYGGRSAGGERPDILDGLIGDDDRQTA